MAVYLKKVKNKKEALKYELSLERELEDIIDFPVDVRIINYAPLSFRFKIIKNSVLLFSKDEEIRGDFESLSIVEYHDFNFLRKKIMGERLLALKFDEDN